VVVVVVLVVVVVVVVVAAVTVATHQSRTSFCVLVMCYSLYTL